MDPTYLSLISFILITIAYYSIPSIGKIPVTVTMLTSGDLNNYYTTNLSRLGIYFGVVVLTQFIINIFAVKSKCGGNVGENVGMAALATFIPWLLIFGMMIAILIMFPGLKSAFSDVVGYFAVSSSANNILTDILIDTNTNELIMNSPGLDETQKSSLKRTAEAILKLAGDKSVLINQIVPENFLSVWNTLIPLMKPEITQNTELFGQKQQQLLDLVVLRENIGEATWYTYTAILLTSIISYNIMSKPCIKDVSAMKEDRDKYLKEQEELDKQKQLNNSTTYTM
jgi:hypothetical protein